MTLKEFIELVIDDSIDNARDSPHLIFPIYVNETEIGFGDISVSHLGSVTIYAKESEQKNNVT